MYTLRVELQRAGKVTDVYEQPFGVRSKANLDERGTSGFVRNDTSIHRN
ncbi:hypothetical protein [uncultured Paenibacillus sp.]